MSGRPRPARLHAHVRGHAPPGLFAREPDAVGDLVQEAALRFDALADDQVAQAVPARAAHVLETRTVAVAREFEKRTWPAATATARRVALRRRSQVAGAIRPTSPPKRRGRPPWETVSSLPARAARPPAWLRVQAPDMMLRGFAPPSWPAAESRGIARAPLVAASQVLRVGFGMPSILSQPAHPSDARALRVPSFPAIISAGRFIHATRS